MNSLSNDVKEELNKIENLMMHTVLDAVPTSLLGYETIKVTMSVGNLGNLEYTLLIQDISGILERGLRETLLDILTFNVNHYDVDSKYNYLRKDIASEGLSDKELINSLKRNKEKFISDIERVTL